MKMNIGIVDDHQLFLKSLEILIDGFSNCSVTLGTVSGEELLHKLGIMPVRPDIVLIDVNMPVLDGPKTAERIARSYPEIKMVALSMKDDETSIIRMLKAGCCCYLLKDIHPTELEKALEEVHRRGYFNIDMNYRQLMMKGSEAEVSKFTDREKQFLHYACTDLTYKEIAVKMSLSERTVDGYREALFEKLHVKSRVGMALEAIRRDLVSL